jgi:hypothetical protein
MIRRHFTHTNLAPGDVPLFPGFPVGIAGGNLKRVDRKNT